MGEQHHQGDATKTAGCAQSFWGLISFLLIAWMLVWWLRPDLLHIFDKGFERGSLSGSSPATPYSWEFVGKETPFEGLRRLKYRVTNKGMGAWDMVSIMVVFYDANGNQVGNGADMAYDVAAGTSVILKVDCLEKSACEWKVSGIDYY